MSNEAGRVAKWCGRCNAARECTRLGKFVAMHEWVKCRVCGAYSLDPEPCP